MELSPTEQRNPDTVSLDRVPTRRILELMNNEDRKVAESVADVIPSIENAVDLIVSGLREGGRVCYVGAGTSGRLGLLDAVEWKPTFGVGDSAVVSILAGGKDAAFASIEEAEDNFDAGRADIAGAGIGKEDVVVGISASGSTPYVLGALEEALSRRATRIGIACNRPAEIEAHADVAICPIVGPEVIAGSTRLKAGTAQKLILNMLSTASMVRMGKVYENLMVGLIPTNKKLKERAIRTISGAASVGYDCARTFFERSGGDVRAAIVMARTNLSLENAKKALEENGGFIFKVLEEYGEKKLEP